MNRRALLTLAASGLATPALAGGGGGGAAAEGGYFRLPTLTGTLTRADGRRGVLSVEAGLDVPDADLRQRAEQSAPRLSAAYAVVVQRIAAETRPGRAPDVERLVNALQAATNTTLRRRGARFLVGTVMAI